MKLHDKLVEVYRLLIHDDFVELDEIAAPGPPDADKLRLYVKDVGGVTALAIVDADGTETTILARTRYAPLIFEDTNPVPAATFNRWPDAITTTITHYGVLPSDYVPGTDVICHTLVRARATGNVRWTFTEYINLGAGGEVFGGRNPEAGVGLTSAVVNNNMYAYSRTVNGVTFTLAGGDIFYYAMARVGADAADTAVGNMDSFGSWMEYTAFF